MRRIYFLSPNLNVTEGIISELKKKFYSKENIHVIAKDNLALEEHQLPKATLKEISDLLPSLKKGALLGLLVGLLAGIIIKLLSIKNIEIDAFGILGFGALGSIMGAWGSSLIGISVPNEAIVKFEGAINNGEYLLILDISNKNRLFVSQILSLPKIIKKYHPSAVIYKSSI